MKEGTKRVWDDVKNDIPQLQEREIQDTLWHYYFNVPKTITYLRSEGTAANWHLNGLTVV
jgi:hypothetical protein